MDILGFQAVETKKIILILSGKNGQTVSTDRKEGTLSQICHIIHQREICFSGPTRKRGPGALTRGNF